MNQNIPIFFGGVPCSFFGGCIYFPKMLKELEFLNHEVGGAYSHLNSKSGIQANAPCSAGCKMVGSDMML